MIWYPSYHIPMISSPPVELPWLLSNVQAMLGWCSSDVMPMSMYDWAFSPMESVECEKVEKGKGNVHASVFYYLVYSGIDVNYHGIKKLVFKFSEVCRTPRTLLLGIYLRQILNSKENKKVVCTCGKSWCF